MKKLFLILSILLLISCKNTVNYNPSINFIGGNGLIAEDVVLKPNQQFRVGINSFAKGDSKLYNFKVTRIYNNTPEIIVDSIIKQQIFNTIMTCPTATSEGTERWTFSITCEDGYSSEVSFLIKTSASDTVKINSSQSLIKEYKVIDLPNKISHDDLLIYISLIVLLIFVLMVYFIKKMKMTVKKIVEKPEEKKDKYTSTIFIIVSIVLILFFTFLIMNGLLF
jgi:hypothetical protein